MAVSLLRHVNHAYRPHTAVLVQEANGQWLPIPATAGATSGPGLLIYRFGAALFYANAGHFADEVRALVASAPARVRWLVVDAGAITSVDYSAARALRDLQKDLVADGVALVLVHVEPNLRADLDRHRLTEPIGAARILSRLRDALAMIGSA